MSSSEGSIGFYLEENFTYTRDKETLGNQMNEVYQKIARASNAKEIGIYEETEVLTGQRFPGDTPQEKRSIYRKVIDTGALPNAATSTVAHSLTDVTSDWTFTRIYGTAKDSTAVRSIPLPNGSTTYPVCVWADATNVYIESSVDLSAFDSSQIVIEFSKN